MMPVRPTAWIETLKGARLYFEARGGGEPLVLPCGYGSFSAADGELAPHHAHRRLQAEM